MGVNAPNTCELQVQKFPSLSPGQEVSSQINGQADSSSSLLSPLIQVPIWGNPAPTLKNTLDVGVKKNHLGSRPTFAAYYLNF